MSKDNAIKRAHTLGYTIKFREEGDVLTFRKPGAAMNALNHPHLYATVQKAGCVWQFKEHVAPSW